MSMKPNASLLTLLTFSIFNCYQCGQHVGYIHTLIHYCSAQNHVQVLHTLYLCSHYNEHDLISLQPNLKAYMLLMIFFFLSLSLSKMALKNPFRHLFNQLPSGKMRGLDPLVSIVALCDEFGTMFEKKSWIYNLREQSRGQRQLTEWNPSRCCNGYNYTKKRAVRLNYPWYSPWVMTEIQKVKWHQELNDFWH